MDVMDRVFVVTATTGEYADKISYNVFACMSLEDASICLRAIDNWFQLRGTSKATMDTIRGNLYYPTDYTSDGVNRGRRDAQEAFEQQFGMRITIDYTGVEFNVQEVLVFHGA